MSDEKLTIDFDDLTFEELEELEDILDKPFDEFFDGKRSAKVMRGLAFIAKRRQDPEFTWEDAKSLRVRDAKGASDPTAAGD